MTSALKSYYISVINRIWSRLGYLIFRLKYPNTRYIRPIQIGTFYSQEGQDLFLSSLLFPYLSRFRGSPQYIVDVGCNHPRIFSNSLFFEEYFKANVIAIDPLEEFEPIWEKVRPSATFVPCALGDAEGVTELTVSFGSDLDNMISFVRGGFNKRCNLMGAQRIVEVRRLSSILSEKGVSEVLLLSIDVEGYELQVLNGIDFDDVTIRCIVVENNSYSLFGSEDIRTFLSERNFEFYARIGHLDDVFIHGTMCRGI